ncbi:MAG: hypothetical protein PHY16_04930 [Methylobacter sp.]|nr:hypothetical protein [Methylobacter sp.]
MTVIFMFPGVKNLIARLEGINDNLEFSEYLIEKAGVALVPGSAFGCRSYQDFDCGQHGESGECFREN